MLIFNEPVDARSIRKGVRKGGELLWELRVYAAVQNMQLLLKHWQDHTHRGFN